MFYPDVMKAACLLLSLALLSPAASFAQSVGYEPEEEGFSHPVRRPQPDDRFCVSKDARGTWKVERVYLRGVGKSCDAGRGVVQYRVQVDVSDPALKDALARAH